jgi:hypothetical protein
MFEPMKKESKIPEIFIPGILSVSELSQLVEDDDVGSLKTLRALFNSELDLLAFLQVLETLALNGREVYEYICAALTGDEAVTLGPIEPLDCTVDTFRHFCLLMANKKILEGTHWVLHRSPPQRRKTKRLTDDL